MRHSVAEPAWLPALVRLADCGSDWNVYLDILYRFFRRDFVENVPQFQGMALRLKRHPMRDGKEATFWHFISEGEDEQARAPDELRCERIRWPRPIIEHVPCSELRCWRAKRSGEWRIVIAFDDFSYVVVLAERAGYFLPWTAYLVERNHRRRKLQREWEDHQKALKPPPR